MKYSRRMYRFHWDSCGSSTALQYADCTYVCFMVWPQIACLIAIKKQRPHTAAHTKCKQTMAQWKEQVQKRFSWNFAHSWKTQNSCKPQSAAAKLKMGKTHTQRQTSKESSIFLFITGSENEVDDSRTQNSTKESEQSARQTQVNNLISYKRNFH